MSLEQSRRIGRRLKDARERLGLTQQQFAEALRLRHRQTIASIEAGQRRVSARELIQAMQVLGVDLDYFTDPFLLVGEGQFSFRTNGDVEQGVLDRFEQQVGRWIAMYRELSREQGHPPRWLGYKLNLSSHSSLEDAQAAGEAAVDLWALGPRPAERLRSAMEERLGILVLQVDAPAGVSGAASRVRELSCAFVNRQESEGRRNFDLAHELFHLLTWDALPPARTAATDATRRGKQWRVEKLAENFAAALLMPEEIVRCHWESRAPLANLHDRINKVAAHLKVSALACKWRLYNLGLAAFQGPGQALQRDRTTPVQQFLHEASGGGHQWRSAVGQAGGESARAFGGGAGGTARRSRPQDVLRSLRASP